ncbi:MAG: transcriptional repressor [Prevotella sp.]|nr:transcriptional repressor [Prevotella sp.]
MTHEECSTLLESHGVKPTANRIVVARALALAQRPLTLSELEYQILSIDKSGVFRTLTLFRDHHLVHTIDDGSAGTRYELCHSHSTQHDDDLHVHFFCEQCQRTFCFEQMAVPPVELPQGFSMTSASYIVKGICDKCQQ